LTWRAADLTPVFVPTILSASAKITRPWNNSFSRRRRAAVNQGEHTMRTFYLPVVVVLTILVGGPICAAESKNLAAFPPTRTVLYKTVSDVKLSLHVFEPEGHKPSDKRPAIVFFCGGGWVGGSPGQFYPHCLKHGCS
jgi:acetyl esterase/lipase